jgi:hypothetical protein
MARIGIDYLSTGTYTSIDSYDSTKWNLGSVIYQYTSLTASESFIGPQKIGQAYPENDSIYTPFIIDSFTWSSTIDWVFGVRPVSGSTTFAINFYEYNRVSSVYTYKGYLFANSTAVGGTHTLRGFAALYYTYTGTAFINLKGGTGKRVSNSGGGFTTRKIAAGARIGFSTTDPTQVTTWYTIDTINSDNQLDTVEVITIYENFGTPEEPELLDITYTQAHLYVIEELRFAHTVTNTTATNGGLFLTKGVNYGDFNTSGTTTILGATGSIDNLKRTYWLADASTVTNTVPCGLAIDGNKKIDFDGLTHSAYVIDSTSTRAYMYNLGASDSITTGKMTLTQSNIAVTAAQTVTGTLATLYNGKIATTRHGPGQSIKSLYFVSSTRLYRASVSDIINGKTGWFKDVRNEIASGASGVVAVSGTLNYIDYDTVSDKFLVYTTAASGNFSYVTKFVDDSGDRFEYNFLFPFRMIKDTAGVTSSSVSLPFNNMITTVYSSSLGGITHLLRPVSVNAPTIYSIPISTHWEFASSTNQVAISPIIYTPNSKSFVRVVINNISTLGSEPFVTPLNDIRTYYRTDGIIDNSGKWYLLGPLGDLSFLNGSKSIQFKFEFQMLGITWGLPGRLLGFTVIYDDLVIQANHQPSVALTTSKSFAWRFSATYSTTLPDLRVRLYNTTNNQLILDDNTASPEGTFEKTTDGGSNWTSWNNSDKTNETTYIRYTPSGLSDGLKIRAILTQNT